MFYSLYFEAEVKSKIRSSLYSRYYAEACDECGASRWRHCVRFRRAGKQRSNRKSDLHCTRDITPKRVTSAGRAVGVIVFDFAGLGIEPQIFHNDSDI